MTLKILGVCISLQDQHCGLLDHSISSSYERVMIKIRNQKSWRNSAHLFFNFFLLEWMGGNEGYLKEFKRGKNKSINRCHVTIHVWDTCGTLGQRSSLAVYHTWSPLLGFCPSLLLSRSSCILRSYSGLRTPILNPSSDYELWLPHTQHPLQKFDKMLRNHLGKWCD